MNAETRILLTTTAIATAVALTVASCVAMVGCGFKNDPHPITPEPGLPCGRLHYSCHDVCCYHTDICRPGGYCVFGGVESPTWGAARDGGAEGHRGLSPEDARKAAPR